MDMSVFIEYDPEADILLVRLRPGEPRDEQLLDSDVVLGIGEGGEILYIEVWDASKRGLVGVPCSPSQRQAGEAPPAAPRGREARAAGNIARARSPGEAGSRGGGALVP